MIERKSGFLFLAPALLLAGCGGMAIKPESPQMPPPLVVSFPASVGVHYDDDFRQYVHDEERWGAKWQVTLGESHVVMMNDLLRMAFARVAQVRDPKSPQDNASLDVVFQPNIDRYSFITPRDSGGGFFAVTIRYRLEVFAPDGRLADTLTITGYGGAPATGFSSSKPMILATQAAMRDAAAKFLVQFPEQRLAKRLRAGEPLVQEQPAGVAAGAEGVTIEPVPIFPSAPGAS
jgi:hypothetical protein